MNGSCREAGNGSEGKLGLAMLGRGWGGEPTFGGRRWGFREWGNLWKFVLWVHFTFQRMPLLGSRRLLSENKHAILSQPSVKLF